ncbi:MAG: hypothetical protein L3J88_01010 [Gammaproteobacteria bacterium]|nr:hypothetical protein [Gammaproteobacteria bacterium]MCF6361948.1 hypothetical protein [Gammaproteobacteria bacterium]
MNFDFLSDLADELQRLLQEAELTVPTYEQLRSQDKRSEELKNKIQHYDLSNFLVNFFTVYSRRIPVTQWNVHISSKLERWNEISDIARKLESGEDVNGLLSNKSKKLNQAKHADLLRSEWGIYHLHFKESRSEKLLFVYFNMNNAYLIDIMKHEKADGSSVTWTNTDLIQIMHDNWPHVIEPYIFKIDSDTPVLTTEQRRTLRKKAANTTIVVSDGTEYMPLGGGFSHSKYPILAVIQSDSLLLTVKQLQAYVKDNYPVIKETLVEYTSTPNLKLKLDDNFQPLVVESEKGILLNLQANEEAQ